MTILRWYSLLSYFTPMLTLTVTLTLFYTIGHPNAIMRLILFVKYCLYQHTQQPKLLTFIFLLEYKFAFASWWVQILQQFKINSWFLSFLSHWKLTVFCVAELIQTHAVCNTMYIAICLRVLRGCHSMSILARLTRESGNMHWADRTLPSNGCPQQAVIDDFVWVVCVYVIFK